MVYSAIIDDLSNLGDDTTVRIRYDGEIRWELSAILSTSCDMDVTYFPYDSQTCDIELTSWGFHTDAVNLTFLKTNLDLEDYSINGGCNIVSTSKHSSELTEEGLVYSEIVFEILSNYYILSVIIPVIITAVLTSVTFILPVESGEKVGYILTVLLSPAVLLTLFADSMPTTSKHTSVLVRKCRKLQNSSEDTNRVDQSEFTENNRPTDSRISCKDKVSLDNIKPTYTNIELAEFFDNFLFVVFTVLYVLVTGCFTITLCVAE
ncbi:CHRNA3 [Mytilus coruscus]|uniref:CHRNA3 n=1 Tax=Mytilus coruscus TaxID=42192 RepID=A0A6J8EN26_MYTCO|nr:CHRNA3 [Mytilus coruscus]